MGVIKVESFDVDVTTSGSTHTLTNSVTLANAFIRRTTSIDKCSGPTTSTSNAAPNIAHMAAQLTGTSTITFYKNESTSIKCMGEVWRYTGSSGGADEFITRGRYAITLSGATASQSVSGISNVDDCVPFYTGHSNPNTSTSDYDASTVAVWIDGSGNIQLARQATTGTLTVYVTVVEFTGSNWSVGHGVSSSHDTSNENVTLNTSSTGAGGSTFYVDSWSNAMIIESSLEGDTSETGLSDVLGVWTTDTTSTVNFVLHQDSSARNDGSAYCHVISHPALIVHRSSNTNISEGNGTYANAPWPTGASTTESLDELSLEWFSDTSGVGTAHARGRLSARITAASGTISYWVHRSGNNVRADWGVVELASLDNTVHINITDVDTDEIITNTQQNVIATASGGGFESSQGTGKLELVENSDYTGTKITQSIDSWSDTSIQFDTSAGALADSNCFLFVTNNSGEQGFIAITVGVPPETYLEALEGLSPSPSHVWTFQNTYADDVGSATANGAATGGTPTFSSTRKLAKGDTYSLQLDSADYISPADQSDMNVTVSAGRRYIGGWIQLDSIHQVLEVIYEEGAQVNNMAFLLGFGNIIMDQVADTGDDYAQAYSDITLTPNRPYHILLKFHASGYDAEVRLFLDGVLQARSNGNPWSADNLDTHSGNITWGHEGTENLQVGDSSGTDNTDIAFASPNVCNYSHWANWTDVTLSTTQIRETLFEKGAPAEETISGDTESNMQSDMDLLADTQFTDWPCSIEIGACTDGDFELTMDNITFEERVSMQIRYMGGDTLTLVTENGTVLDTDKLGTPYGGTISVIHAVPVTVTVKDASTKSVIQSARVLILADSGGDLPYEDSVSITRSGSTATVTHTAHGMVTGSKVKIKGSTQEEYWGVYTITVTDANTYTYTVSGTPATPATGSPVSTAVIISGTTDVNGEITENLRYTSDQPISGYARYGSAPYYQQGNLSATVTLSGYNGIIFLVGDG